MKGANEMRKLLMLLVCVASGLGLAAPVLAADVECTSPVLSGPFESELHDISLTRSIRSKQK